jgi:hypothetical protein
MGAFRLVLCRDFARAPYGDEQSFSSRLFRIGLPNWQLNAWDDTAQANKTKRCTGGEAHRHSANWNPLLGRWLFDRYVGNVQRNVNVSLTATEIQAASEPYASKDEDDGENNGDRPAATATTTRVDYRGSFGHLALLLQYQALPVR